jgi:hypothetical protein
MFSKHTPIGNCNDWYNKYVVPESLCKAVTLCRRGTKHGTSFRNEEVVTLPYRLRFLKYIYLFLLSQPFMKTANSVTRGVEDKMDLREIGWKGGGGCCGVDSPGSG